MGKETIGMLRTTVLIDPQGQVARTWDRVKADGHAKEVLATLEDLRSGS